MVHVSLHLAHIHNAISSYSAVRRFHSYNHIHTGSCSQPPLRRTQSCASPLPSLALHYSLTWLGSASAYLDTTRSHALQPSGCVVRHVLRLATPHASSTLMAPLPYLPSTRSCTQPRYPEYWTGRALDALCATQRRLKRYPTSNSDLMALP